MILNEQGLDEFTDDMRVKGLNIDSLRLRYNPKEPYALIDGEGITGIAQEEDYYLNLKENLLATEFSWFQPICNLAKTIVVATVPVKEDGNFDHDNVRLEVNFRLPQQNDNIIRFMYPRLKSLVLFYPYAKQIEFKGSDGEIRNIYISFDIEGKKVAKTIRENKINKQIFDSWLSDLVKVSQDSIGNKRIGYKFNIINGKINYHTKIELISKRFNLSEGDH